MSRADFSAEAVALIERIAAAIRNELNDEIDAYPGHGAPETSDPLNRAFRAIVAAIVAAEAEGASGSTSVVSWTLRHVTEKRLLAEGWNDDQVRWLIEDEPGSPDDWFAFLLLSSRSQVDRVLNPDRPI